MIFRFKFSEKIFFMYHNPIFLHFRIQIRPSFFRRAYFSFCTQDPFAFRVEYQRLFKIRTSHAYERQSRASHRSFSDSDLKGWRISRTVCAGNLATGSPNEGRYRYIVRPWQKVRWPTRYAAYRRLRSPPSHPSLLRPPPLSFSLLFRFSPCHVCRSPHVFSFILLDLRSSDFITPRERSLAIWAGERGRKDINFPSVRFST